MTATDELRRLLDERGIEHDDEFVKSSIPYCVGYEGTYWGGDSFCYVEPIRPKPNTIGSHPDLTMHDCTPEQAIAATLGAGECLLINAADDLGKGTQSMMCFGCGYTALDDWWDEFNYCPNCGRKVKR